MQAAGCCVPLGFSCRFRVDSPTFSVNMMGTACLARGFETTPPDVFNYFMLSSFRGVLGKNEFVRTDGSTPFGRMPPVNNIPSRAK